MTIVNGASRFRSSEAVTAGRRFNPNSIKTGPKIPPQIATVASIGKSDFRSADSWEMVPVPRRTAAVRYKANAEPRYSRLASATGLLSEINRFANGVLIPNSAAANSP